MIQGDFHTHSILSGHAYATFYEIINEAKRVGLKAVAITDHGPSMEGVHNTTAIKQGTLRRAPKELDGMRILLGCEANILNNGSIDLTPRKQEIADVVLACLHEFTPYVDEGEEKNTENVIKALKQNHINIISHPTHFRFPVDKERIWKTAIENNILLEVNCSYLSKHQNDKEMLDVFRQMITTVKEADKQVIVNSDAHFLHEVGDDSILEDLAERIGLNENLIINVDINKTLAHFDKQKEAYLKKKGKIDQLLD